MVRNFAPGCDLGIRVDWSYVTIIRPCARARSVSLMSRQTIGSWLTSDPDHPPEMILPSS
jgi:hypothetical protein